MQKYEMKYKIYAAAFISIFVLVAYAVGVKLHYSSLNQIAPPFFLPGMIWFMFIWVVGIGQLAYGAIACVSKKKKDCKHHIYAGAVILATEVVFVVSGQLGYYITN